MNVHPTFEPTERLTTSQEVFRKLRADIIKLRLAPGAKLSEVEVAKAYQVSRQPVREAFMRLGELDLLQIRPQKATRVRKISLQDLRNTRFLRAALEVEVVRVACRIEPREGLELIRSNLDLQARAVAVKDTEEMHELDYQFHRLICQLAGCLPAFKTIAANKAHTDRVCTLELSNPCGMGEVLEGHTAMFDAIEARDEEAAVAATRFHLSHLDDTLAKASESYPDYFEE
ncbi:GntR family transcriptional regulator [Rhizobiaceae bacterium]|nr:GntR family transcriptional regulator [Rhizobiaceae bacterium]